MPLASLLLITLLLWLPGGFHMTGLKEEWWHGHLAVKGPEAIQLASADRPVFVLRPLLLMPWVVSAMIPPNVIVGQNVLLFLLFFGKAAVLYGVIVEIIPSGKALAFLSAVLFITFPASTGLYSLRVLLTHTSAFWLPFSLYLLMRFNRTRGVGWLIGSLATSSICLLSHESAFLLAMVAPFLLCIQTGWNRRTLFAVGSYLIAPIGLLIRYVLLWVTIRKGYQAYLVDLGMPSGIASALPDMVDSIGRAFGEVALHGWRESIEVIAQNTQPILPTVLIAAICLAVNWRIDPNELPSRRTTMLVFGAGIGAFVLGFVPYLPTALRSSREHVFIVSAAGASLSVVSACLLVARLVPLRVQRAAFSILACALIGLASIRALAQHRQFIDASNSERRLLASVIEAAPGIKPDTCLVMLNAPIDHRMFFYGAFWADAVGYLNDDFSLQGMFCSPGGVFACAYDPAEDAVVRVDGYRLACATERLIVFEYTPNDSGGGQALVLDRLPTDFGDVDSGAYQPRRRIEETLPDAAVLDAVFGAWPYPK